jgi:hypothetical protein
MGTYSANGSRSVQPTQNDLGISLAKGVGSRITGPQSSMTPKSMPSPILTSGPLKPQVSKVAAKVKK